MKSERDHAWVADSTQALTMSGNQCSKTRRHSGPCNGAARPDCPGYLPPRSTPEPSVPCNDTMPNKPITPLRSIRISDTLWKAAQERAAERGETVTDVIRAALEKYVRAKS